ncbi:MAG: flagellar export chaperone FliS [Synergistaceae bacterium]|nr:flagellar export chaperone FliS [Synergistaceae bacterium]
MVNPNAQFTYQATRISTATKEQLLLITYDIGIKACHTAENALLGKTNGGSPDYDLANREIIRAQEVIRELMVTLNRERGGEVATKLIQLYEYMYQLLVDANIKKEPENVRTVCGMLEELKQTWEEALLKLLKEYQAAHPEDKDLQNAMAEVEGRKPEAPTATQAAPAAYQGAAAAKPQAAAKNAKAGTFTLAG